MVTGWQSTAALRQRFIHTVDVCFLANNLCLLRKGRRRAQAGREAACPTVTSKELYVGHLQTHRKEEKACVTCSTDEINCDKANIFSKAMHSPNFKSFKAKQSNQATTCFSVCTAETLFKIDLKKTLLWWPKVCERRNGNRPELHNEWMITYFMWSNR